MEYSKDECRDFMRILLLCQTSLVNAAISCDNIQQVTEKLRSIEKCSCWEEFPYNREIPERASSSLLLRIILLNPHSNTLLLRKALTLTENIETISLSLAKIERSIAAYKAISSLNISISEIEVRQRLKERLISNDFLKTQV